MSFAMRLTLALITVAACSREPHDPLRAVSEDVRAGRYAAAARRIAATELTERPSLAFRAASDAPADKLDALAAAATEPELAAAVADRLEEARGPAAALAARERAAAAAPDRAEHHDALARARFDAGQTDAALAAWDRAAALAPLQPAYHLAPVRALAALGQRDRACARAEALAEGADAVEPLLIATSAAAACGDHPRAAALARAALALRPTDGRLAFTLGERLIAAGDPGAARVFAELLLCGAHGRPWHRHEVSARLAALAGEAASRSLVVAALAAQPPCAPVEPADLAIYVDALRAQLK